MSDAPLFRARADECRAQADESTLQNVKERCLRAAAAWAAMAERGERADAMRAAHEKSRAGHD